MQLFTDSAILLLYSMLAFFYVPADQSLVFSLLFTVILGCVTYLCRTSEIRILALQFSTSAENLRKYPSGSCRKFMWFLGSVPCGLRIFFCFSHCFCIRHYLPDFFFWQWWNFHSGDSLLFSSTSFRKFSVSPEALVLFLAFFLWSHTRQYELLARNFRQSRDDSEEHALLLSEKNKALLEKQDYEIYAATLRERNRIARKSMTM